MKRLLGLLFVSSLAACTSTANLERAVQSRAGSLGYVPTSMRTPTKDRTLAITSFVAEDLFDRVTTVKRTSTFFLPLVVFNLFKSRDNVQLGQAQLKSDYRQFFKSSLLEEIERSGRYKIKDVPADFGLNVKIRSVDISAPINQSFLLVFPVYIIFWQSQLEAGPADVKITAEMRITKDQTVLVSQDVKGIYQTSVFGKGALPDYSSALMQAVSMATKDLNENIVAELNRI